MDFHAQPLRTVDENGCLVDVEGFYDSLGAWVFEGLLDRVVVIVTCTDEEIEGVLDAVETFGRDAVGAFGGNVGLSEAFEGFL